MPKEVVREMFVTYTAYGGMFLVGLLLMIVLPIGINGCGGKLLIPWFFALIPLLSWHEAKDIDRWVLQPHWHLAPAFFIGLRRLCEFGVMVAANCAIFMGWGTFLDKMDKIRQNRAKAQSPS